MSYNEELWVVFSINNPGKVWDIVPGDTHWVGLEKLYGNVNSMELTEFKRKYKGVV